MGRRKIEIKAIKDDRNRSVTFLKRKGGLFKKAHELSVLCSVDVAVIIFGHNKKLHQFCSGDINEILGRHQYYGNAHEHKGPADFNGKRDMEEDDDDDQMSPPPESLSSQDHQMIPPHLQNQPSYSHMRHHTPSASPPIPSNGVPFHHRQHTPQPQVMSRPSSRNALRRPSSNLVPQNHAQVSQPAPISNGYAYMPNPPIYNPQAGAGMPVQPQPHMGQPPYQYNPHAHPQAQPAYMQEQRRSSMPPAFPQDRPQGGSDVSPPQPPSRPLDQQPMPVEKRAPAKSRSIFTPIDDSCSLLAQHWGFGTTNEPAAKNELSIKQEPSNRSQSVDVGSMSRKSGPKPSPRIPQAPAPPQRSSSGSSLPDIPPPPRNGNSMGAQAQGAKRPRLKVQIPSEQSDAGSATADDSPRESAGTTGGAPSAKVGTDGSHSSGVVLPPPSPSASALLSAGAQGPPNPFARPHPPGSQAPNNNIETPISALPSRFVADGLLPSPGSFYPEWGFGRGPDSNMLPSPLNFQTPVAGNGPSFLRDEPELNGKRKSPGSDQSDSVPKRVKT
ncbi:MAG: hypothetical protein M1840_007841 [Geoglossum simile]|nr:MAG: hypothetical protein M1840_007841 [Geoglossum simile]